MYQTLVHGESVFGFWFTIYKVFTRYNLWSSAKTCQYFEKKWKVSKNNAKVYLSKNKAKACAIYNECI